MTPPVGGPRERCPFFGRTSNATGLILQQCHGKTACRHIPLEDAEAMPVLFSAPLRCPQTWPERFPHPSPPDRSLLQTTARKEAGLNILTLIQLPRQGPGTPLSHSEGHELTS